MQYMDQNMDQYIIIQMTPSFLLNSFFFFNVDSWVNSQDSRVAGPDVMLKHWLTLNRL